MAPELFLTQTPVHRCGPAHLCSINKKPPKQQQQQQKTARVFDFRINKSIPPGSLIPTMGAPATKQQQQQQKKEKEYTIKITR